MADSALCPWCGHSLDNIEVFEDEREMSGRKFILFGLCCGECHKVLNVGLGPAPIEQSPIIKAKAIN